MSPGEMTWQAAIKKVLGDAGTALHYADIAERIVTRELRNNVGATPSNTVYAVLAGKKDVFEKVAPATFRIRRPADSNGGNNDSDSDTEPARPITALGMFWERDLVSWTGNPSILGAEQPGAVSVNMTDQNGVYLLAVRL